MGFKVWGCGVSGLGGAPGFLFAAPCCGKAANPMCQVKEAAKLQPPNLILALPIPSQRLYQHYFIALPYSNISKTSVSDQHLQVLANSFHKPSLCALCPDTSKHPSIHIIRVPLPKMRKSSKSVSGLGSWFRGLGGVGLGSAGSGV